LPRSVLRGDRSSHEHRPLARWGPLGRRRPVFVYFDEPAVGGERQACARSSPRRGRLTRSNRVRDRRRDDRADRDATHREAQTTRAHGEDVVEDDPLKEREHRHVLDAVGSADDREHENRGDEIEVEVRSADRNPKGRGNPEGRQSTSFERHRHKAPIRPPTPMAAVR
jgi:hypothetical protein